MIQSISPRSLKEILEKNSPCHAIDVREMPEIESEHVEGLTPIPLSGFPVSAAKLEKDRAVYILCKSGMRAQKAAEHLSKMGHEKVFVVEGGIQGWKSQGLAVRCGTRKVWSLERQVRFAAGALVFLGGLLGHFFHPMGWLLSIGVSLGLMVSAVTDTCTMGLLLARCPWNRSCP